MAGNAHEPPSVEPDLGVFAKCHPDGFLTAWIGALADEGRLTVHPLSLGKFLEQLVRGPENRLIPPDPLGAQPRRTLIGPVPLGHGLVVARSRVQQTYVQLARLTATQRTRASCAPLRLLREVNARHEAQVSDDRRKTPRSRLHCLAALAGPNDLHAVTALRNMAKRASGTPHDRRATGPVDRPVDTAAAKQRRVRCVHDRVNPLHRDVPQHQVDPGMARLHYRVIFAAERSNSTHRREFDRRRLSLSASDCSKFRFRDEGQRNPESSLVSRRSIPPNKEL